MQPTREEIAAYLAEDVGGGDLTANIIPASTQATATVVTRENAVLCGQAWFDGVFEQLNPDVAIEWLRQEGETVAADTLLCRLAHC